MTLNVFIIFNKQHSQKDFTKKIGGFKFVRK